MSSKPTEKAKKTIQGAPKLEDDDDKTDSQDPGFKRTPTLRVSRQNGKFTIKFQPIRINEMEEPLNPVEFKIADQWSDGEQPRGSPSDDSDLDIEYIAPAAFMRRDIRKKPLVAMIKQECNLEEIENVIKETREKQEAELRKAERAAARKSKFL
ncbi:hypothetical protein WDU94_000782 [Cyamophila willieti]